MSVFTFLLQTDLLTCCDNFCNINTVFKVKLDSTGYYKPPAIMAPRKPSKESKNQWDLKIMKKALKTVLEGKMGLQKAAQEYSVPRTSLYRFIRQIKEGKETNVQHRKIGRKPVLTEKLEESLVEYALELQNNNFSLTGRDLREMAYHLAVKHGIKTPFAKDKIAGTHWLKDFLRRNPKLLYDESMHEIERDLLSLTENLTCETLIDEIGEVSVPDEDDNDYCDDDDDEDGDEYDDYQF